MVLALALSAFGSTEGEWKKRVDGGGD